MEHLKEIQNELKTINIIAVTLFLIISFLGLRLWFSREPSREINVIKEKFNDYNTEPNLAHYEFRKQEFDTIFSNVTNQVRDYIYKKYKITVDWSIYQTLSYKYAFVKVNNTKPINVKNSLNEFIDIFSDSLKISYPKEIISCSIDSSKSSPMDMKYGTVTELHVSDFKKKKVSDTCEISFKAGQSVNTSRDTNFEFGYILIKAKFIINEKILLPNNNETPFISKSFFLKKNWESIKTNTIESFNSLWEKKLSESILDEKNLFFGFNIENKSIAILSIFFLLFFYLYSLSYLVEIKNLLKESEIIIYKFTWVGLLNNKWASILRVLCWLFFPFISMLILFTQFFDINIVNICLLSLVEVGVLTAGIVMLKNVKYIHLLSNRMQLK